MEEVVRRTGLTPRTIRYYEELGLLVPSERTSGGFRLFSEFEIKRLLRIKALQELLGFTLSEIRKTLQLEAARADLRQAYADTTDPGTRRRLMDEGVRLIETQLRLITARIARLSQLQGEYEAQLARLRTARAALQEKPAGAGGTAPASRPGKVLAR
jgi:DNA-binding transcriptional MerR regulator